MSFLAICLPLLFCLVGNVVVKSCQAVTQLMLCLQSVQMGIFNNIILISCILSVGSNIFGCLTESDASDLFLCCCYTNLRRSALKVCQIVFFMGMRKQIHVELSCYTVRKQDSFVIFLIWLFCLSFFFSPFTCGTRFCPCLDLLIYRLVVFELSKCKKIFKKST